MLQANGLPFSEVLTKAEFEEAFHDQDCQFAQEDGNDFTPALTLWAFPSQVLLPFVQHSCLAAVSRVIVLLVALGRGACAKNSGAYCKARAKLPEQVIERLTLEVAQGCEKAVPRGHRRWNGLAARLARKETKRRVEVEKAIDALLKNLQRGKTQPHVVT